MNKVLLGNNVQNDMLSKHIFRQILLQPNQIGPNIRFLNSAYTNIWPTLPAILPPFMSKKRYMLTYSTFKLLKFRYNSSLKINSFTQQVGKYLYFPQTSKKELVMRKTIFCAVLIWSFTVPCNQNGFFSYIKLENEI